MKRQFLAVTAIFAMACGAESSPDARAAAEPQEPTPAADGGDPSIVAAVREAFQQRNPRISRVTVLEVKGFYPLVGPYIGLAWGIREDMSFAGDFNDESFGLFVFDSTLTRIERTIDVFPTGRWLDYAVWIDTILGDSVFVLERMYTYRDEPSRRGYAWR